MSPLINEGTSLALRLTAPGGQTLVQSPSPLTRLNYFDGKFLRADDLRREQDYLRQLVQFSNQGLGAGIVYGMDTTLDGQQLSIGPGLAMDSDGRTLLISAAATLDIGTLIDSTRRLVQLKQAATATALTAGTADFAPCMDVTTAPTDSVTPGGSLYVICVGHAESLCGTEDVYGRLCEEACVTATDRPYLVEGVIVRAVPLTLRTPCAKSRTVTLTRRHLRSLVASAYFEDERHVVESLISGAGLALDTWCVGAEAGAVGCVPLAVVARAGTTTIYLDAWTARRERIEAPARRYWAWRMAMRPWDVYLAQILQFQCQLHEVLGGVARAPGGPDDPCAAQQQVLSDAADYLRTLEQSYSSQVEMLKAGPAPANTGKDVMQLRLPTGSGDLALLRSRIDGALKVVAAGTQERVLINGGIVELPSAGYLPVVAGIVTVNEQVRRLLGEGLDLRFCVVRPDFVAHALEEAQHMERISLLTGLDDPTAKPEVDILVPNGQIVAGAAPTLSGFDTKLGIWPQAFALATAVSEGAEGGKVTAAAGKAAVRAQLIKAELAAVNKPGQAPVVLEGSGRVERLAAGGGAFYFAGGRGLYSQDLQALGNAVRQSIRNAISLDAAGASAKSKIAPVTPAPGAVDIAAMLSGTFVPPAGAIATEPPRVAVWASMRTELDPFAMQKNEDTRMGIEMVLASAPTAPGTDEMLLRMVLDGTLRATRLPAPVSVLGKTGALRMTGHFTGSLTAQVRNPKDDSDDLLSLDVTVMLLRTGTASTGSLSLTFQSVRSKGNAPLFELDASWDGQSTETVQVNLSLDGSVGVVNEQPSAVRIMNPLAKAKAPTPLLDALLQTSSDALTADSNLRNWSTAALKVVGNEMAKFSLGGPGYADGALQLLFPSPPQASGLTVQPTLDWVLFHRRRTKKCAVTAEAPVVSPSRRYWLYEIRANNLDAAATIRKQVESGTWRGTPISIGAVEYAGGLTTLLTPATGISSDLKQAQAGDTIVYGAIATTVAADAPLGDGRLASLAQALAADFPENPNATMETLPQVPAIFSVPQGNDGIMFLLTMDVAVACEHVYAATMEGTPDKIWKGKSLADILRQKAGALRDLGIVYFTAATGKPTDQSLIAVTTEFEKPKGAPPTLALVYQDPGGAPSLTDAALTDRGQVLLDAMLATKDAVVMVEPAPAGVWPEKQCPVVVILVTNVNQRVIR